MLLRGAGVAYSSFLHNTCFASMVMRGKLSTIKITSLNTSKPALHVTMGVPVGGFVWEGHITEGCAIYKPFYRRSPEPWKISLQNVSFKEIDAFLSLIYGKTRTGVCEHLWANGTSCIFSFHIIEVHLVKDSPSLCSQTLGNELEWASWL